MPAQTPGLIPRERLFGNPTFMDCQISPDGRWLSWCAPEEGVLNIWIAPVNDPGAAHAVTSDRKRGIRGHWWMHNATHLLYSQDAGGTDDWHLHAVDIASGGTRNLTPFPRVSAQVMKLSIDRPNVVAVAINDRDPSWHDIHLIDVLTGSRELLFENRHELTQMVLDSSLALRFGVRARAAEGGYARFRVEGDTLIPLDIVEAEDEKTTVPLGFTRDGKILYSLSSVGRDTSALIATDWETGAEHVIAQHAKADIGPTLVNPVTGVMEAAGAAHVQREWVFVDQTVAGDFAFLEAALPGEMHVVDRTHDDRRWVVVSTGPESPADFLLYDRDRRKITPLFSAYPALKSHRLAPMHGEIIQARDGLELVSFLTLPAGEGRRPARPLPMVLAVHGGPWWRDHYGYKPDHQWLANRGVAVLSVNFRGSTGFGKRFVNAGDREWGRKMHDDLIDAVEWAVAQGIARRDRVAIMGASYGGYATLAGLTFTPDVFCCGVDIVGPSNLQTLIESFPAYWAAVIEMFTRRVGDPRTEDGRALLRERSPLYSAGNIVKPLLIAQGANDPRVRQAESDQIVEAMKAKGLPVTYVLYPEEGHGFVIPENDKSFHAIAEAFLGAHLGFAAEPIGSDFKGATFEIREGADHIPELSAALAVSEVVE